MTITFCYDHVDSALWRMSIYYPLTAIKESGDAAFCFNVIYHDPGEADVYIFYRCTNPKSLAVMQRLKDAGKFVIYAIDDYVFEANCKYAIPNASRDLFFDFFKTANAVMASNGRLLDHIPVDRKIRYHSTLDMESVRLLRSKPRVDSAPFSFAWLAGSNHHSMDEFVKKVLELLDERLPSKSIFHRYGKHIPCLLKNIEVVEHPYVPVNQWKELYSQYSSFGLDATISPLPEDEEFCHCKATLKYIESAAMEVPIIVSRMSQFTEVIREKHNGMFASSPEEFADKVLLLFKSPGLARDIAANARIHLLCDGIASRRAAELVRDIHFAMEEKRARIEG